MADDRSDSEILANESAARSEQDNAIRERRAARLRLVSLLTLRGSLVSVLLVVVFVLGKLAYTLHEQSYGQLLAAKAAGGIATFLIIPWIVVLLEKYKVFGTIGAITVSVALAVGAGFAEGTSRDFLIEGSIGLALAVALDFLLHGALAKILAAAAESSTKLKAAREKFEAAKQKALNAENELDYKYAVNDYLGLPRGIRLVYLVCLIPMPKSRDYHAPQRWRWTRLRVRLQSPNADGYRTRPWTPSRAPETSSSAM